MTHRLVGRAADGRFLESERRRDDLEHRPRLGDDLGSNPISG